MLFLFSGFKKMARIFLLQILLTASTLTSWSTALLATVVSTESSAIVLRITPAISRSLEVIAIWRASILSFILFTASCFTARLWEVFASSATSFLFEIRSRARAAIFSSVAFFAAKNRSFFNFFHLGRSEAIPINAARSRSSSLVLTAFCSMLSWVSARFDKRSFSDILATAVFFTLSSLLFLASSASLPWSLILRTAATRTPSSGSSRTRPARISTSLSSATASILFKGSLCFHFDLEKKAIYQPVFCASIQGCRLPVKHL